MKIYLLGFWFLLCAILYWLCAQTAFNLYNMPVLGKFYYAIVPGIILSVMIASYMPADGNREKKRYIPWTVIFLIAVLSLLLPNWYKLATDDGWSGWPAESRCGVCRERIWTWQAWDMRKYAVGLEQEGESSTIIDVRVSMSGPCHTACEGTPREKVKLKVGTVKEERKDDD